MTIRKKEKKMKSYTLPVLSEAELFSLFNVECATSWSSPNSLHIPLLKVKVRKAKVSKRVKHTCDKVKAGITEEAPGKSRVADLARFYAANAEAEISAFEV